MRIVLEKSQVACSILFFVMTPGGEFQFLTDLNRSQQERKYLHEFFSLLKEQTYAVQVLGMDTSARIKLGLEFSQADIDITQRRN